MTDPPVGACPVVHGAGHAAPFAAPVNAVDARVVAAPPDDVGAPMRSDHLPVWAEVGRTVQGHGGKAVTHPKDAACAAAAVTGSAP